MDLWFHLYNLGIQGKTWRLLRNWYSELSNRVITSGVVSAEFSILPDVRPFTLAIYDLQDYNNDLPRICDPNDSLWLSKLRCSPIMVADDIAHLSARVQGLQQMLSSLEKYSEKWRFEEFNPTKTRVITFGESSQMWNKMKSTRRWTLFDTPVKSTNEKVGIERCQRFNAKRLQVLLQNTRSEAVTGSIGL